MDIELNGMLYVYFIKSVFENNKKNGIEMIIDTKRSDVILIDGLQRLNQINKNKIFILNDSIKIPIKIYDKKYITNITFKYVSDKNNIQMIRMDDIRYDKIEKIIDNKIKLQNYATGKNKSVQKIMDIINN
jgi:hypothetical protein